MSLNACAAIVEKGDPDRFLAVMSAPVAARARLFPLFAFNLEVARAPWMTREAPIAEIRLQWWRDAVAEIAAGKTPRAHDVVRPLADVMTTCGLPAATMDALILARRWDIYREPFANEAAFAAHIEATGGGLMWLAVKALGAADQDEAPARAAGRALALANWFRAIPALEAAGAQPLVDGRPAAVAQLAEAGLADLAQARAAGMGRALYPALRTAWLAQTVLRQAATNPARVAQGSLGLSEFGRRARLLALSATGRW